MVRASPRAGPRAVPAAPTRGPAFVQVVYSFSVGGQPRSMLFFWQGRDVSGFEVLKWRFQLAEMLASVPSVRRVLLAAAPRHHAPPLGALATIQPVVPRGGNARRPTPHATAAAIHPGDVHAVRGVARLHRPDGGHDCSGWAAPTHPCQRVEAVVWRVRRHAATCTRPPRLITDARPQAEQRHSWGGRADVHVASVARGRLDSREAIWPLASGDVRARGALLRRHS
eukprot:scaffold175939_cov27-Tisochrysis_lutea.AAC.5